ncbi:hypothetical protein CLV88_11613 [Shimia abyssi]|uniref:Uncharacterized protein n=1 Tax=Shimia abyssi TaxID=1662395 RepID=A0A2P8F769_9RHOB|nr:hypothetical protein CLV88_11613 [Shimia abyssi]
MNFARILAIMFALFALAVPAFAWEPPGETRTAPEPPAEPTPPSNDNFEATGTPTPTSTTGFSSPTAPAPPGGPTPPSDTPEEDEEDEIPLFAKKKVCEGVSVECVIDGDRLLVKFSEPQDEEMVQAGLNFCRSAKPAPASLCCYGAEESNYKIKVSEGLSDHSHYRAKRFCMCAWGLD